ncbi:3-dehydroquinate synthase, prokaryotic [Tanacetum coccineum]
MATLSACAEFTGKLKSPRLANYPIKTNCVIGVTMSMDNSNKKKKQVWIWTENKQVMTSAVERGWNTFLFDTLRRHLATDWSSIAKISPLFIEENRLFNENATLVATFSEISSPQQLEQLQPVYEHADNVIVDLLDWQYISIRSELQW